MKIVYKIIAALLALAVIPVLIAAPIIFYRVQSPALQVLLTYAQSKGSESVTDNLKQYDTIPNAIADGVSVKDAFSVITNIGNIASSIKETTDEINGTPGESAAATEKILAQFKTPLITSAVIAVMMMICGIVIAAFAVFSKNNRLVIFGSLAGIGLSVMFMFSFDSLAAPIMSGGVNISSLINTWWAGLIANFEEISLSSTFYLVPAIFVVIIVWTVLYNYTLPEEEKAARKKMLGEDE